MQVIQLQSRVGADGVLKLNVPMGPARANSNVVVTIQSEAASSADDVSSWQEFIHRMYGSCAGTGLERGSQGSYELREPLE